MGCLVYRPSKVYNTEIEPFHRDTDFSAIYANQSKISHEEALEDIKGKTIITEISKAFKQHASKNCLGYRLQLEEDKSHAIARLSLGHRLLPQKHRFVEDYTFLTYEQVEKYSNTLAKNLIGYNFAIKEENHFLIGIFAQNCAEWVITDIACQLSSITSVAPYSLFDEKSFELICRQTKINTLCVSPDSLKILIKYMKEYRIKFLIKNIILYDLTMLIDPQDRQELLHRGYKVYNFSSLVKSIQEKSKNVELNTIKDDEPVSICYTSGIRGPPKGAIVTQNNFYASNKIFPDNNIELTSNSTHFSYIPLSNTMERSIVMYALTKGAKIGFCSGKIADNPKDCSILDPTFLVITPKQLKKFRDTQFQKIYKAKEKQGFSAASFSIEIGKIRKTILEEEENNKGIIKESLVNQASKSHYGNGIQFIVTGSALLTKNLSTDIKFLLGKPIVEVYGKAATSGSAFITDIADFSNNSVGGAVTSLLFKLKGIEGTQYVRTLSTDGNLTPSGELYLKGPTISKKYFKSKEVEEDGWFKTGDICMVLYDNNGLKVLGRTEDSFKLLKGEYIIPGMLEGIYSKLNFISQIVITTNSKKKNIVGIIIVNYDIIEVIKKVLKWKEDDEIKNYMESGEVTFYVADELAKIHKEAKLKEYEALNNNFILIAPMKFDSMPGFDVSEASDKLDRNKVVELFKDRIEKL